MLQWEGVRRKRRKVLVTRIPSFFNVCLSALTIRATISADLNRIHAKILLALRISPSQYDVPSSMMELHGNELAEVDILMRNLDQIEP